MANPKTPEERYHFLYRWFDADGVLLYVGVTHQPVGREKAHLKTSWWTQWADRCVVDPPILNTRAEAEALETSAIVNEAPAFNKRQAVAPFATAAQYLTKIGLDPNDFADHFPTEGRPKSDNPRDKPLSTWVTEEEKALVEAAAKDAKQPLSTWLRELAMTAARKAERSRHRAESERLKGE